MSWLVVTPLIAVGTGIFLTLITGFALGYYGNVWLRRVRQRTQADQAVPDHLLTAVLGLLALLLGFTFSLALNRYEARRALVVQEANAIGTAWLRVQLLEEPHRADLSRVLRDYAQERLSWSEDDSPHAKFDATTKLQNTLWPLIGLAMRNDSSQLLSRAVMDAMNESFDVASARSFNREAHLPERVFYVLLLYAFLSAAMLGYVQSSKGEPHQIASALVVLLVTLAMVLILDIDRPLNGGIKVSQKPMEVLLQSMERPASP